MPVHGDEKTLTVQPLHSDTSAKQRKSLHSAGFIVCMHVGAGSTCTHTCRCAYLAASCNGQVVGSFAQAFMPALNEPDA